MGFLAQILIIPRFTIVETTCLALAAVLAERGDWLVAAIVCVLIALSVTNPKINNERKK